MIDPLVSQAIACGMAALFLLASWHKFGGHEKFAATLAAYRVLPRALLKPVAVLLPLLEAVVGASWLIPATRMIAAAASIVLLLIYLLAMAINLGRGRVHIDCGCGLTAAAAAQPLSTGLIFRNAVLIVLAALATLPVTERALVMVDYLTLAASLLSATLIYIATTQLLQNRAAMRGWMRDRD